MKRSSASVSVGAGGSHTEMEISLCDVTNNLTAVNKVSTSVACASALLLLLLSSASSSFCVSFGIVPLHR